MMAVSTKEELITALEADDFDAILGTPEGAWIDFKSEPYGDVQKTLWEYPKDVAAFANADGGVIVLGYKTGKTQADLEEKAVKHRPIPKKLVDPEKMAKTLATVVYPEVRGVQLRWFPPETEAVEGVLLIEIPVQSETSKPFILRKVFGEGENPLGNAVGIPTRDGGSTSWGSAESLHATLSRGEFTQTVNSIHAVILELRDGLLAPRPSAIEKGQERLPFAEVTKDEIAPPATARRGQMDERIVAICRELEWEETPTYFLQAVPPLGATMLSHLHGRDGIAGNMLHPPLLRQNGWHIALGITPEVRDSGLVIRGGSRNIVWLDRDGLFTAGAAVTPEFLGWGVNPDRDNKPGPYTINSLALVEYTLEFFRFVHAILAPRAPGGTWGFRVLTRGFKTMSGGVRLRPGRHDGWFGPLHPASGDAVDDSYMSKGSPGGDALTALISVYALFGLGAEDVPFTENGAVSEEMIKAVR